MNPANPAPRPLSASDTDAAGALLASAYPHRAHEPARWGGTPNAAQRWSVAAPDGSLAAYLALWPVEAAQFRMDLVVGAHQRRRGLGATLLDFLIERAREAEAASLQARPYAEQADALALLVSRDFRETMRMYGLLLDDVRAAQLGPVDWYEGKLAGRGIRVTTLADELADELAVDPQASTKLRDANHAAQPGWLDPDPPPNGRPREPQSVEQYRAQSYDFHMIPEACFIALKGDQYVGYSVTGFVRHVS